jgi:hypothetical protein
MHLVGLISSLLLLVQNLLVFHVLFNIIIETNTLQVFVVLKTCIKGKTLTRAPFETICLSARRLY